MRLDHPHDALHGAVADPAQRLLALILRLPTSRLKHCLAFQSPRSRFVADPLPRPCG